MDMDWGTVATSVLGAAGTVGAAGVKSWWSGRKKEKRIADLERKQTTLQEEHNELHNRHDQLDILYNNLKFNYTTIEARYKELEIKNRELERRLTDAEVKSARDEATIKELRSEVLQLGIALDKRNIELAEAQKLIASLQIKVGDITRKGTGELHETTS